jgi:hypothetical protein
MRRIGAWRGCDSVVPVPDAMQHAVVHRWSATVTNSAFVTIPVQQRTTSCCAAPGQQFQTYASSSSGSKCGRNQICAIKVGTMALPITAVSSTVYCAWSIM